MLLDFQRSADQVFDPQQTVITDDGLLLGVRDKNVTMLSNEDGSVTAFTPRKVPCGLMHRIPANL